MHFGCAGRYNGRTMGGNLTNYYSIRAGFATAGGRIEVVEPLQRGEARGAGYYPALVDLGQTLGTFAISAKVRSRGPDSVAQQILSGSRYLVARFVEDSQEADVDTIGNIIAAARIGALRTMSRPHRLFGLGSRVPFVAVHVLEAVENGLAPVKAEKEDAHFQRCRAAAAAILYTVATEPEVKDGYVQVTGRYGRDFTDSGCDPRDPEFFSSLGFRLPRGAPEWGTEGSAMVAPAQTVSENVIRAYGSPLQIA